MKKIISIILLLPFFVWSQEPVIVDKKISCTTTEIVLQSLTEKFFEKPIWLGEGSDSLYSIFVSKNGSWTIIQFNNQIACVIGVGKSSKQIYLNTNR